ncbi:hypothetical protein MKW94_025811 [Papaver nudicaule]|uniref:RING-type domain-containing protein n=1 Tax=Papaver nudicaule TaxID=74823 RepID=A0AA42AWD6_PAPNU|nr:hypothetical protein [Papaver nudicaule]MCL7041731.1 hypothetical protein [Papaver nudicaule]
MDEEQNHHHLPVSPSSSSASINEVPADSTSSSSASSQVQEEEEDYQHEVQQEQELHRTSSSRVSIVRFQNDLANDDSWSCLAMLVTFWFFASMTMILGFCGPLNLRVGPNCSRLIQVNSFFIADIKVQELAGPADGVMLYSFHNPPPLDVETTWSETYNASLPAYTHEELLFFLNKGSAIDISYSVKSPGSFLFLVIAEGKENLAEWTQNPSYPNITLSWNIIQGTGVIQQELSASSDYYVAVGNLNLVEVEVHLSLRIRAILYNTTEAYFKCSPTKGPCFSRISFMRTDVAVLTSSGLKQGPQSDDWYVTLSYGERWMSYILGSGILTVLVLVIFKICVKCQSPVGDYGTSYQPRTNNGYDRTPLLVNKDDDVSSWGSSYCSGSNEDEDLEDALIVDSLEGKLPKDGENSNPRRLCVVCFDAPRDCFFLPCGHCATCFTCGTRIAEEAGTCPICRRKMKKVKKIFAV